MCERDRQRGREAAGEEGERNREQKYFRNPGRSQVGQLVGKEAVLQALARGYGQNPSPENPQHLAGRVSRPTTQLLQPRVLHALDGTGSWGSDGSGDICLPGLRTYLPHVSPTPLPAPAALLLPWGENGRCLCWSWGGGSSETPVRTTILLSRGNPFPTSVLCPCCSAFFKCVSAWGEGRGTPSCPLNLTKSHGCCSPLCMTQMLRCTKPTTTTKKRPCTATLGLSVFFCLLASPGRHRAPAEVRGS